MAKRPDDDDDDDRERGPRGRSRDEDDEPRVRRRRDEEDDDGPRRPQRSRSRDDDYDDEPRPKKSRLSAEKIRSIAIRQKVLIFCILFYILAVIGQVVIPEDLRIVVAIPGLIVALLATVFVFLLSMEVHGVGMGILFGFLTLIPCIGLIVLLIVNQQATTLLQKNGVRVGLLGANMSDVR